MAAPAVIRASSPGRIRTSLPRLSRWRAHLAVEQPPSTTVTTAPPPATNRLAAIHSLFGYLALHHPEHAGSIQRVLAIPPKRTERNLLTYLTDDEVTRYSTPAPRPPGPVGATTPCSP